MDHTLCNVAITQDVPIGEGSASLFQDLITRKQAVTLVLTEA